MNRFACLSSSFALMLQAFSNSSAKELISVRGNRSRNALSCHSSSRGWLNCARRSLWIMTNLYVGTSSPWRFEKISPNRQKFGFLGANAFRINCVVSGNVVIFWRTPHHHWLASPVSRSGSPASASTVLKIVMVLINSSTEALIRITPNLAIHCVKCLDTGLCPGLLIFSKSWLNCPTDIWMGTVPGFKMFIYKL